MFFYALKFLWLFAAPSHFLMMGLFFSVSLLFTRFMLSARWFVLVFVAGLMLSSVSPLPFLLARSVENRFAAYSLPSSLSDKNQRVDAIVVLGGAVGFERGMVTFNEAASRMNAAVEVAKLYPDALLVFSGGGRLNPDFSLTESDAARAFFLISGIPESRIVLEDRSRNTRENALFTASLLEPKKPASLLLVTSAYHMPRAIGCFRAVGFDPVAYPVDYRSSGTNRDYFRSARDLPSGLRLTDTVVKEWIGMVAYYVAGYSLELFPAERKR